MHEPREIPRRVLLWYALSNWLICALGGFLAGGGSGVWVNDNRDGIALYRFREPSGYLDAPLWLVALALLLQIVGIAAIPSVLGAGMYLCTVVASTDANGRPDFSRLKGRRRLDLATFAGVVVCGFFALAGYLLTRQSIAPLIP